MTERGDGDGPAEAARGDGPEPARPFSTRVVDPLNSVAWFAMDATWMCKLAWPAYTFTALTLATGVWLLVLGWRGRRGSRLANLGLNCWIVMNAVWLVSDLNGQPAPLAAAVPLAVLGAALLSVAAWYSQDVRRLRIRDR